MASKVTINDKVYPVPELDFNAVCELNELGVDIMNAKAMRKNALIAARAIVAWIMDADVEEAGMEIQEHIVGGGGLEEIFEAFNAAVSSSGFFTAMGNRKTPQDHKRKATKATSGE